MDRIRDAIHHLLAEDNPMTVRQVFYPLVCRGVIAKTEGEYKQTVVRLLTAMRRSEEIPFGWIADNTRWHPAMSGSGCLRDRISRMSSSTSRTMIPSQTKRFLLKPIAEPYALSRGRRHKSRIARRDEPPLLYQFRRIARKRNSGREALERTRTIEEQERQTLANIQEQFGA